MEDDSTFVPGAMEERSFGYEAGSDFHLYKRRDD